MTSEVLQKPLDSGKPVQGALSIVTHETIMLKRDLLTPHPLNRPATGLKPEQVETLKTLIEQNGYNASKPITVRPFNGSGEYQIIEGHHRWKAATELGYTELPCVIEDLNDVETNLRLLMSNQQEGNDPLDIGLNALATVEKSKGGRGIKSEMSVSGFAKRLGKSVGYLTQVTQAATVYQKVFTQVKGFDATDRTKHLFEIHSAHPDHWALLATAITEKGWSSKDTKAAVERVNSIDEILPAWLTVDLGDSYSRAAAEPGFAKSLVGALKALDRAYLQLPEQATFYVMKSTDEVKDIDGREHRRFIPDPIVHQPRVAFLRALSVEQEPLSAATADRLVKRELEQINAHAHASEEWRQVLTDAEEHARYERMKEIERLTERERFMPRLLQGDVVAMLRTLPSARYDLICIDPPYNMDKTDWDSFGNGHEFAEWARPWLTECVRVLKDSGAIYIFGINRMLSHLQGVLNDAGLLYRNWIIWDTIQGAGGGLWVNRHEAILYYSKTDKPYEDTDSIKLERHEENVREYKGKEYAFKNPSNVWRFPCVDEKHPERTEHPTQKPVELIERIVRASCPVEGAVLDCFIGSGTTGVACMRQRRHCTGIDQSRDYLAIAQSRFDATEIGQ